VRSVHPPMHQNPKFAPKPKRSQINRLRRRSNPSLSANLSVSGTVTCLCGGAVYCHATAKFWGPRGTFRPLRNLCVHHRWRRLLNPFRRARLGQQSDHRANFGGQFLAVGEPQLAARTGTDRRVLVLPVSLAPHARIGGHAARRHGGGQRCCDPTYGLAIESRQGPAAR
jgi:hypothetical protein